MIIEAFNTDGTLVGQFEQLTYSYRGPDEITDECAVVLSKGFLYFNCFETSNRLNNGYPTLRVRCGEVEFINLRVDSLKLGGIGGRIAAVVRAEGIARCTYFGQVSGEFISNEEFSLSGVLNRNESDSGKVPRD